MFITHGSNIHLEIRHKEARPHWHGGSCALPEDDWPGVEPARSTLIGHSGLFTQYMAKEQKDMELEMFDNVARCRILKMEGLGKKMQIKYMVIFYPSPPPVRTQLVPAW